MVGFLSGQFGESPFYKGFDARRNAIGQFGLGLMQGKTLQEGLTAGVDGALQGRKQDSAYAEVQKADAERLQAINETAQWLRNKAETDPLAADFAALIDSKAMTPAEAVTSYYQQSKPTGSTQDWSRLNDGTLYNQRTGETQAVGGVDGQSSTEYGLTPIWGKLPDGTFGYGVQGKDGSFKAVDTGDLSPLDPRSLAAERTGGGVDERVSGGARAGLPAAEQAYDLTAQTLDRLIANKDGASDNFGSTFMYPNQNMEPRPGTARANMKNDLDQLSGNAFLTMRQTLKGAGQVTDYEGAKAEAALTVARGAFERGDQKAFDQALKDYRAAVENGMRLLRLQANNGYSAGAPAVTGGAVDYQTKYGLE